MSQVFMLFIPPSHFAHIASDFCVKNMPNRYFPQAAIEDGGKGSFFTSFFMGLKVAGIVVHIHNHTPWQKVPTLLDLH